MENVECNLCGKDNYEILYKPKFKKIDKRHFDTTSIDSHKYHGQIVRCKNCNLVYVNPRAEQKKIIKAYADVESLGYLKEKKQKYRDAKKILKLIENYQKPGKLLDLGCFVGFFLRQAERQGWDVYGVEPSRWAVSIANKLGLKNVKQGSLESVKLKDNFFDAVVMIEVIEHLDNPYKVLTLLNKKLKIGGTLAIVTPKFDSIYSKLLKNNWWFIENVHLYYFTEKTISKILKKTGFKIIKIKRQYKTFLLSYIFDKLGYFNKRIFSALKRIIKKSPLKNTSLPVYSGEMLVIARKIKNV